MKIGFVGLGKMGANMVQRLIRRGHEVVVYDQSPEAVQNSARMGSIPSDSHRHLSGQLPSPKIVWLMVPSGEAVDSNIEAFIPCLGRGDIIIDGGNSNWRVSQKRAEKVRITGIDFLDCGTSGGIWGLENGYCLMIGGSQDAYRKAEAIFQALAPEHGYLYCGPSGAGHFVKMVHNGVEYGLMESYAEGFELLQRSPFDLDLKRISKVWQYGSVVRSWLLELIERVLLEDPKLERLKPYVEDSGEGRWTVKDSIDFGVPAPVIAHSLYARFLSRNSDSFSFKLLAALRNQFGGHAVKTKQ